MILNGEGIKKNAAYALLLIEQTALEGQMDACLFLRDAYTNNYYDISKNIEKSDYYNELFKKYNSETIYRIGKSVDLELELNLSLTKPILQYIYK